MLGLLSGTMNTLTDRLKAVHEQVSRLAREHQALRTKAADLEADRQVACLRQILELVRVG